LAGLALIGVGVLVVLILTNQICVINYKLQCLTVLEVGFESSQAGETLKRA
jgi:hypothetical protein